MIHFHRVSLIVRVMGAVVIWLLASTCSFADKIVLNDGDVIEGVVTRQGRTSVVLEHSDLGRMEIPRSRIKSLTINTPDIEVVLKDGDTIQGRLVKEDQSVIVIEHRDLGRMEIPRERILSSRADVPDAIIELASGDTIEGKLIERSDYAIILEHPNLGRIEIPRERIDSVKIKEPEFKKKQEEVGWFDPQLRKLAAKTSRLTEQGWKTSVDLSINSSTGNTEERAARFGNNIERELIDRRTTIDLSYYTKSSRGKITDNKLTLGIGRDWLYPGSVWFWFVQGRFDYNEFESWQQRANAQAGPGYHLVKSDHLNLDGRLGLGARKEWGSRNNNVKFEGLIGADFDWDITEKQKLTFMPYFFPVLGDFSDYRSRVSGEWRFLFDKDMNLSFFIGTLYEYSSIVDPGTKNEDIRLYMGLRFGF